MCKIPVRRREVCEAPEDVLKVLESFQAIIGKIEPEWKADIKPERLQELMSKQSMVMDKQKQKLRDSYEAAAAARLSSEESEEMRVEVDTSMRNSHKEVPFNDSSRNGYKTKRSLVI